MLSTFGRLLHECFCLFHVCSVTFTVTLGSVDLTSNHHGY